jgi:hypothetical protein
MSLSLERMLADSAAGATRAAMFDSCRDGL